MDRLSGEIQYKPAANAK